MGENKVNVKKGSYRSKVPGTGRQLKILNSNDQFQRGQFNLSKGPADINFKNICSKATLA